MTKFVLYSAGAYEWRPEGVFDTREDVHNWIKKTYDYSFEDFLEEEPNSSFEDWYNANEVKVEEITYYPTKDKLSVTIYIVYSASAMDWEQDDVFQTKDEAYAYIAECVGTVEEFEKDYELEDYNYPREELFDMWLEEYEYKIEEVDLPK